MKYRKYREILELFAGSRDLDLGVLNGEWCLLNFDLHYRHPISLSLYREIVGTYENHGEEAFGNIDLLEWRLF